MTLCLLFPIGATYTVTANITQLPACLQTNVLACFMPIPVISTNPLMILLANPTAFINAANSVLLSVCVLGWAAGQMD